MALFNGIEGYGDNHIEGEYVELAFDTKYRGIWQCRWTQAGMSQYASEPPFESLTTSEQEQIEMEAQIVFKFTHGKV